MASSPAPLEDDREMALFEAALAIPEPERPEWLKNACGESTELLCLVTERLAWETRMGSFLLSPLAPSGTAPPPGESRPFLPGDVAASRFEIKREVAEGGMAVVYEAFDRKTGQTVAIKCPKPPFQRRLLSELRSALRVTHPNICRLYEIHSAQTSQGEFDFLTMEFLEGETLAQRLRRGQLEREEALAIARQLCAGLGEAHSRDIVHGDLKPGNVILTATADGAVRAVITDFGLARNFGVSTEGVSAAGSAMASSLRGTPDYIAPELWRGEPVSPASDIYALGVILHELLTGELPSGTQMKPDIPKRWRRAMEACLAEDPARRPSRTAQVEAALRPRRSRAWVWATAAALGASSGAIGLVNYWYATAVPDVVRLAILPAQTDGQTAVVGSGVEYDISDRLLPAGDGRKPLVVIPLWEAERFHIAGVDVSRNLLGATHALILHWRLAGGSYEVEGTIYDTSSNRLMRSFRERYDPESLGGLPELVAAKLSATLKRKVSIGGGTISSAAYRDYAEGMHYLREAQDPGRARNSFDKALKDQGPPSVINLRVAEAEILDYPGTHSPASLARASLILDRPGPPVRSDAATALLVASLIAARDPAQAPAAYRDAVKTHPESGELWRNLAEALRIANRSPDEAASAYRQAIALEPGYFQPWLNFGVFSIYRGQYEEARDQFARASALAPGLALPHRDLANALLVLNEYSRAEQEYREALNIQRDPDTFVGIGALLAYQGRHADSVYYYEQAAALSPEDSLTLSNLADSYRRTGRTDEALRTYARVIATAGRRLAANPQSAVDRAFKAYALARSESLKPALSEIRSAVRGAPGNVMVRRMAATTFEALGMRREALDQIRAAPVLISELSRQPDLADLRRDPRFIEMSRADINFRKAEHTE